MSKDDSVDVDFKALDKEIRKNIDLSPISVLLLLLAVLCVSLYYGHEWGFDDAENECRTILANNGWLSELNARQNKSSSLEWEIKTLKSGSEQKTTNS